MLNVKNIKMSAFCMVVGLASIFAPVVSTPPSSPSSDQGLSITFSTPGSSPSNKSLEAELAETQPSVLEQCKKVAQAAEEARCKEAAMRDKLKEVAGKLLDHQDRCSALYYHLASFQKRAFLGTYSAVDFADNLNDLLSHCECVLSNLGWKERPVACEPESFFNESTLHNLKQLDKVARLEKELNESRRENARLQQQIIDFTVYINSLKS